MNSPSDLPNWPVELTAPDIEQWRAGNTDIPFFWSFESGVAGPHALVTAVVHGNELCGAIVVDELLRKEVRPSAGVLTVGFCNVAAYSSFDPEHPAHSRAIDEDFNRVWAEETLDGPRSSLELTRARAIRPLVERADYLLDLHSMQNSTVPLTLSGSHPKGVELAKRTGYPEVIMIDAGHAAGKRMRDYRFFDDPSDARASLLVECGQHWEANAETVARETLYRFLLATGTISRETADPLLSLSPAPQKVLEITHPITVKTDHFRFAEPFMGMEVIEKQGTILGYDGDEPVRTPFDDCVLIMPSRRLAPGQTAVRLGRYVG